jgi:glycosyltransferase involved in cell wall biosynthesis
MKIVIFMPNLCGGGVEKSFLNLAEFFRNSGFNIKFVIGIKEGNFSNLIEEFQYKSLNTSKSIFCLFPLIKFLRLEKPDIVITGMPHSNAVVILAKILSRFKGKIIVSVHENPYSKFSNKSFYERVILKICSKLYRYANGFVAVSEGLMQSYVNRVNCLPIHRQVIGNPILRKVNLNSKKNKSDCEILHLLAVGRLTYEKNFELTIRAFAKLKDKSKFRLKICGEGDNRGNLEALVEKLNLRNFVSLPGFIDDVYQEMQNSDVLILSSFWEGFGNVLVEALDAGCKIISSDCESGPKEILQNGTWGRLFQVNNEDQLVNLIESSFDININNSGLDKYLEQFTFDSIGREYLNFISRL